MKEKEALCPICKKQKTTIEERINPYILELCNKKEILYSCYECYGEAILDI